MSHVRKTTLVFFFFFFLFFFFFFVFVCVCVCVGGGGGRWFLVISPEQISKPNSFALHNFLMA